MNICLGCPIGLNKDGTRCGVNIRQVKEELVELFFDNCLTTDGLGQTQLTQGCLNLFQLDLIPGNSFRITGVVGDPALDSIKLFNEKILEIDQSQNRRIKINRFDNKKFSIKVGGKGIAFIVGLWINIERGIFIFDLSRQTKIGFFLCGQLCAQFCSGQFFYTINAPWKNADHSHIIDCRIHLDLITNSEGIGTHNRGAIRCLEPVWHQRNIQNCAGLFAPVFTAYTLMSVETHIFQRPNLRGSADYNLIGFINGQIRIRIGDAETKRNHSHFGIGIAI